MRTTVDIPDPLFREMKIRAASEGTTIKDMIVEAVVGRLRSGKPAPQPEVKRKFPAIRSKNPGSPNLGEEGVYEYIPFP